MMLASKRTGFLERPMNVSNTSKNYGVSIMAMKLPLDFKEFLKSLNAHGVEYLLIGGYAVGYYGYPRATGDMDIWIAVHPDNADRMVRALKSFGFDSPDVSADIFLQEKSIIRMGRPPIRIEIITKISGVSFEECYSQRVIDTIDGVQVALISLPHLKINKQASGRHKDLDDLEHLP